MLFVKTMAGVLYTGLAHGDISGAFDSSSFALVTGEFSF